VARKAQAALQGTLKEDAMPRLIRAIVVDPSYSDKLTLQPAELPPAVAGEVTVRVTTISLNRGEVNRALSQPTSGRTPGLGLCRHHRRECCRRRRTEGRHPRRGHGAAPGQSAFARPALQSQPCPRLRPHIEIEAPWTDIAAIARRLIARDYVGKAVLHVT
jgi:hypothetical protein